MDQSIAPSDGADAPIRPRAPERPVFSQVERMVIDISRNDPVSGLDRPGPAKRFFRQLIGIRDSAPFAAPRLEALRRMAVALRAEHADYVTLEEQDFYAAGFDYADLVHLAAIIDGDERSSHRQRQ